MRSDWSPLCSSHGPSRAGSPEPLAWEKSLNSLGSICKLRGWQLAFFQSLEPLLTLLKLGNSWCNLFLPPTPLSISCEEKTQGRSQPQSREL